MSRLAAVYSGPKLPPWERLVLRYSRSMVAALAFTLVCIALAIVAAGWRPHTALFVILVALFAGMLMAAMWAARERDRLVREAPLPRFLRQKLMATYPHLTLRDTELVERGLRQFFIACQRSHRQFVAMPSQVVDSMWHEFILHTSAYREWCDVIIGRFIDHVPAEVLGRNASTNDGLRRAWFWACKDESIDPRNARRLPLLFALDAKFAIPGGFAYVADCSGVKRDQGGDGGGGGGHCGESFSDASYSGDADGFGGSDSSSSSGGGGDGGSDGGGGCGSGCGGGGD